MNTVNELTELDTNQFCSVSPTSFTGTPLSEFTPVTEMQLHKLIMKSRKTFAPGIDPVPTKFILQYLDVLLPVIVAIVNTSLLSGSVPKCFKYAVVRPLLKKPTLDPTDPKNFRPVSNLPYLSKVLERVVASQLIHHLHTYNCLDKFQSAYRPGFSTETALLRVVNDILTNIDSGNLTLLVLLDLSAAFDTINHQLLLERLSREMGVTGVVHQWFMSYFQDRTQRVCVGQSQSTARVLTCGVPQGSVLGPILFSLYTAQLGSVIQKHLVDRQSFADDSQLYTHLKPDPAAARGAITKLESCCSAVKSWMSRNMLKLNDGKTEVILLGPTKRRQKIGISEMQVCESIIPFSVTVRDLGLILDAELSMVPHINRVVQSCNYFLRLLSKLRPFLSVAAAKTVALALIISRVDYCNSTFWGLPSSQLSRLQKIQNTAARIVTRTKVSEHITPVLNDLHWLPVKSRIDHKILTLTFACLHNSAPSYLQELIPSYTPSRSLRSSSQSRLRLPSTGCTSKKKYGARSFIHAAPKLWNSLPDHLKEAESCTDFRKQLKTHFFSCPS